MSEISDIYAIKREESQRRRELHRVNAPKLLEEVGIKFQSKNGGAHLIVEGAIAKIDFWPGTGRWNCRSGKRGFGVFNLMKHIKEQQS